MTFNFNFNGVLVIALWSAIGYLLGNWVVGFVIGTAVVLLANIVTTR